MADMLGDYENWLKDRDKYFKETKPADYFKSGLKEILNSIFKNGNITIEGKTISSQKELEEYFNKKTKTSDFQSTVFEVCIGQWENLMNRRY